MLYAIKHNALCIKCASKTLLSDLAFIRTAIEKNSDAVQYLPKPLQNDPRLRPFIIAPTTSRKNVLEGFDIVEPCINCLDGFDVIEVSARGH